MASFKTYPGNGALTKFGVTFPYIEPEHVHVYVDGVETSDWSWFDSSTVEMDVAPEDGAVVLLQRVTPVDEALAEFTNGEALLDEELNTAARQSLYASEEAKDRAEQSIAVNEQGVYDFNGRRATNLATPVDDTDAVTKAYADTIINTAQSAAQTATEKAELATTKATEAVTARGDTYAALEDAEDARDAAILAKEAAEDALAAFNPSAYATAAQGAKADTAVQPADLAAVVPSGTVVFALRQSAPSGWRMFDDGTIGDIGSGATYEAADAEFIFGELFAIANDANCPLLTSAGGATTRAEQTDAATAWAAGCRMSMPKTLGRSLAVAGAGAGLTSRAVGQKVGEETHTPTLAELYAHSHDIYSGQTNGTANARRAASAADAPTGATSTVGSSTPFNVIDPTVYLPAMVKL